MSAKQEHPQADILRAIADGETVQCYTSGGWIDSHTYEALTDIAYKRSYKYRVKPKTLVINGHEVPEPVREPLNEGDVYYRVDVPSITCLTWGNDSYDTEMLRRGLIHLTKEAAIAHTSALLSFTEMK